MPYHYRYAPDEIPSVVESEDDNMEEIQSKNYQDSNANDYNYDGIEKIHHSSVPSITPSSFGNSQDGNSQEKLNRNFDGQDKSNHSSTLGDTELFFRRVNLSSNSSHVRTSETKVDMVVEGKDEKKEDIYTQEDFDSSKIENSNVLSYLEAQRNGGWYFQNRKRKSRKRLLPSSNIEKYQEENNSEDIFEEKIEQQKTKQVFSMYPSLRNFQNKDSYLPAVCKDSEIHHQDKEKLSSFSKSPENKKTQAKGKPKYLKEQNHMFDWSNNEFRTKEILNLLKSRTSSTIEEEYDLKIPYNTSQTNRAATGSSSEGGTVSVSTSSGTSFVGRRNSGQQSVRFDKIEFDHNKETKEIANLLLDFQTTLETFLSKMILIHPFDDLENCGEKKRHQKFKKNKSKSTGKDAVNYNDSFDNLNYTSLDGETKMIKPDQVSLEDFFYASESEAEEDRKTQSIFSSEHKWNEKQKDKVEINDQTSIYGENVKLPVDYYCYKQHQRYKVNSKASSVPHREDQSDDNETKENNEEEIHHSSKIKSNYNRNRKSKIGFLDNDIFSESDVESDVEYFSPEASEAIPFSTVGKSRKQLQSPSSFTKLLEKKSIILIPFKLLGEVQAKITKISTFLNISDTLMHSAARNQPLSDSQRTQIKKTTLLREIFVSLNGLEILGKLFQEPFVLQNDVRYWSTGILTSFQALWTSSLEIYKEICFSVADVSDRIYGRDDLMKFFFSLLSYSPTFEPALTLLEEILADQPSTFPLASIPDIEIMLDQFSHRQLALFCRILALLVFEPEDRSIMECSRTLRYTEILQLRRDRMTRPISTIDENQGIIIGSKNLLEKLVRILHIANYGPNIEKVLYSHILAQLPSIDRIPVWGLAISGRNQWKYLKELEKVVHEKKKDYIMEIDNNFDEGMNSSNLCLDCSERIPIVYRKCMNKDQLPTENEMEDIVCSVVGCRNNTKLRHIYEEMKDIRNVELNKTCFVQEIPVVHPSSNSNDSSSMNIDQSENLTGESSNSSNDSPATASRRYLETILQRLIEGFSSSRNRRGRARENIFTTRKQQYINQKHEKLVNSFESRDQYKVFESTTQSIRHKRNATINPSVNDRDSNAQVIVQVMQTLQALVTYGGESESTKAVLDRFSRRKFIGLTNENIYNFDSDWTPYLARNWNKGDKPIDKMNDEFDILKLMKHISGEDALSELKFNAILLASNQVEVFFVLCTLLCGRRKVEVQMRVADMNIVGILNKMFGRLNWNALCPSQLNRNRRSRSNGTQGENTHRESGDEDGSTRNELNGTVNFFESDSDDDIDEATRNNSEDEDNELSIHGPGCECNPESALRTQFLRLVHNFTDRDCENNKYKLLLRLHPGLLAHPLLFPPTNKLPLFHTFQDMKEEELKTLQLSRYKHPFNYRGLIFKIIDHILQGSCTSTNKVKSHHSHKKRNGSDMYRFWFTSCVESFLRGSSYEEQIMIANTGILKHIVLEILNFEPKCSKFDMKSKTKNRILSTKGLKEKKNQDGNEKKGFDKDSEREEGLQTGLDLLAEMSKSNFHILQWIEILLEDPSDFQRFMQVIVNNLVESNVFLRSVLLCTKTYDTLLAEIGLSDNNYDPYIDKEYQKMTFSTKIKSEEILQAKLKLKELEGQRERILQALEELYSPDDKDLNHHLSPLLDLVKADSGTNYSTHSWVDTPIISLDLLKHINYGKEKQPRKGKLPLNKETDIVKEDLDVEEFLKKHSLLETLTLTLRSLHEKNKQIHKLQEVILEKDKANQNEQKDVSLVEVDFPWKRREKGLSSIFHEEKRPVCSSTNNVNGSGCNKAYGNCSILNLNVRFARLHAFVKSNEIQILKDLMSIVNLSTVNHENICCINTALLIFIMANREKRLENVLKQLQRIAVEEIKANLTIARDTSCISSEKSEKLHTEIYENFDAFESRMTKDTQYCDEEAMLKLAKMCNIKDLEQLCYKFNIEILHDDLYFQIQERSSKNRGYIFPVTPMEEEYMSYLKEKLNNEVQNANLDLVNAILMNTWTTDQGYIPGNFPSVASTVNRESSIYLKEEHERILNKNRSFIVNFRELLFFWREYYSHRSRDKLSVEFSSHIKYLEWEKITDILCADDGGPTSLVSKKMRDNLVNIPKSAYALPPNRPRIETSKRFYGPSASRSLIPSEDSEVALSDRERINKAFFTTSTICNCKLVPFPHHPLPVCCVDEEIDSIWYTVD